MASQVPSSSFNEDATLDLIESVSFGKGLLRCLQTGRMCFLNMDITFFEAKKQSKYNQSCSVHY